MARLQLEDGQELTRWAAMQSALAPLGVVLEHWPLAADPGVEALLERPELDEEAARRLLAALAERFALLRERSGYRHCDLVVLHPAMPNLEAGLAKFARPHTHADDEVRYVVDGEAVFGFVYPDGSQAALTVEAGDCLTVPAGTEHWFHLGPARRVKAVRYFCGTDGWHPEYTGTTLRIAALSGSR